MAEGDSGRPSWAHRHPVPEWMRRLGWLALGWAVPVAASTALGYVLFAAQSIRATPGLQDRVAAVETAIGTPVEVNPPPVTARLTTLETARVEQIERLGLEIRERVGLQVALHRALKATQMDAAQREEIQAAAAAARLKFDDFVLKTSPREAADKVLEAAGVPR